MDHSVSTEKAMVTEAAVAAGLIGTRTPYVSLVDYAGLESTVAMLREAFPDHFLHTFAVKANFYVRVLSVLREAGMGAEVASEGEYALARRAGFPPEHMVFDAPIKTRNELLMALSDGVAINIDNFQEFDLITSLMNGQVRLPPLGFRINPQVGGGSVALSSTATETSKFGIGLRDPGMREQLIRCYLAYPWLNAIHVHVGSVGCPLELMAEGISVTVELAESINREAGAQRITSIDIGGGLPVSFAGDEDSPTFSEYAEVLRELVPELFNGRYRVITEFGRAIVAKNAMSLARVEYTKTMGGRGIALSHAGASSHIRTVLQADSWARRVSVFDARGRVKTGDPVIQDVAGPCCFAGDVIAHQRELVPVEPGDHVLVHDTGAYCFANHFQYNGLPIPPVYGYRLSRDGRVSFDCISRGQSVRELVDSFCPPPDGNGEGGS